jgi:hypothetical protein
VDIRTVKFTKGRYEEKKDIPCVAVQKFTKERVNTKDVQGKKREVHKESIVILLVLCCSISTRNKRERR